jgi:hypothetical protein
MYVSHAMASGMGGMRTAGDLVARVQLTKAMKIQDAKDYVANKLNVSIRDLTDPVKMTEVREALQIGVLTPQAGYARGIEAKIRIAELLDVDINCVKRFNDRVSI